MRHIQPVPGWLFSTLSLSTVLLAVTNCFREATNMVKVRAALEMFQPSFSISFSLFRQRLIIHCFALEMEPEEIKIYSIVANFKAFKMYIKLAVAIFFKDGKEKA